jgi:signal transduction histidine kinase
MSSAYPPGPIEALDAFAEVLADAEAGTSRDAFYGRLCYVICTLASMDRAVIFRYDEAVRRVRVAGTHNIDIGLFEDDEVSVESAPIAGEALQRDAVIQISSPSAGDVPERYRSLIQAGTLVCVPLVAAERWIGVALCDRASGAALNRRDEHLLWTLGKTAALAAAARIATVDIAREVHERVVQRLFGVSLALDGEGDLPADARKRAAGELQRALSELKTVVQQPLGRTSRPTATTLAEEVQRLARTHTDPRVEIGPGSNLEVPSELEPLAQSVLREGLRNAQKHARPTVVTVTAGRRDGVFVLDVVNDGVGGAPPAAGHSTGMGLRLAAFEALQAGGFVEFGARDGDKWQVRLVVPTGGD